MGFPTQTCPSPELREATWGRPTWFFALPKSTKGEAVKVKKRVRLIWVPTRNIVSSVRLVLVVNTRSCKAENINCVL